MLTIKNGCALLLVIAPLATAGCGSSSSHRSTSSGGAVASQPATTPSASSTTAAGRSASPGALSGDAASAATGDILDNQVFLVFHNRAGYSIKYPEGWTQQGSAGDVTFKDKNNLVHIVVSRGAAPTLASVTAQLGALSKKTPSLTFTSAHTMSIGSSTAVKTTYSSKSAPSPVTGKRVTLRVDRYELADNGRVAVVDLGTPVGVDNVDAYRMMIHSLTWR
jgi:hypothetical protein